MKKAIVMGATSGIGQQVALQLAERGWQVGIAGRRTEILEKMKAENTNVTACKTIDVTQENADESLRDFIREMNGIDLYFHSSGIGWQNNMLDIDKELKTVKTNALGWTRMIDAAFNMMSENGGGQLAAISSIAGTKGLGAAPAYSATKRFQRHYLECLDQLSHMRRLNVKITDIRPGFVDTALIAGSSYPLQLRPEKVAKSIVNAVEKRKSVVTIDWRYRILVKLWSWIPRCMWVRLKIGK